MVEQFDDSLWLESADATYCEVMNNLDRLVLNVLQHASRPKDRLGDCFGGSRDA